MRANEILKHTKKEPFRPFRVFVSDGATYDIRHPEMMMVGRSEVIIGLSKKADEVYDRLAYCDPVHITRIEPLNSARPRRKAKGPRQNQVKFRLF